MEKTSETPQKLNQTQTGLGEDATRQDRKGSEKRPNLQVKNEKSSKDPGPSTPSSTPAASITSKTEQKSTLGPRDWTLDPGTLEPSHWSLTM
jgi:hypothetical protein